MTLARSLDEKPKKQVVFSVLGIIDHKSLHCARWKSGEQSNKKRPRAHDPGGSTSCSATPPLKILLLDPTMMVNQRGSSSSSSYKSRAFTVLETAALLYLSLIAIVDSVAAFAVPRGGGGRAPGRPDQVSEQEAWTPHPSEPKEARLIVIQVTDVYTLEHFGSLKTLIEETKANANGACVCSVLTGDFLSP